MYFILYIATDDHRDVRTHEIYAQDLDVAFNRGVAHHIEDNEFVFAVVQADATDLMEGA